MNRIGKPAELRIGASGICAPVRNPISPKFTEGEVDENGTAADGSPALVLPSSPAFDRTTPKNFKEGRHNKAAAVANDILSSWRNDKNTDGVAINEGTEENEAGLAAGTAPPPLDPVFEAIKARGLAAMAKTSPTGHERPATVGGGEQLLVGEAGEFGSKPRDILEVAIEGDWIEGCADNEFSLVMSPAGPAEAADVGEEGPAPADISQIELQDATPPFRISFMREWFTLLDDEGAGKITKNQWVEFFKQTPKLRKLFLKDEDEPEDDARLMRRLLRQLKEVDVNKDGFIDWEEFVTFFKGCGYVEDATE